MNFIIVNFISLWIIMNLWLKFDNNFIIIFFLLLLTRTLTAKKTFSSVLLRDFPPNLFLSAYLVVCKLFRPHTVAVINFSLFLIYFQRTTTKCSKNKGKWEIINKNKCKKLEDYKIYEKMGCLLYRPTTQKINKIMLLPLVTTVLFFFSPAQQSFVWEDSSYFFNIFHRLFCCIPICFKRKKKWLTQRNNFNALFIKFYISLHNFTSSTSE